MKISIKQQLAHYWYLFGWIVLLLLVVLGIPALISLAQEHDSQMEFKRIERLYSEQRGWNYKDLEPWQADEASEFAGQVIGDK
jgi:hypothetical protein